MAPRPLPELRRTDRTVISLRILVALLACLHVTLVADELRGAGLGWVGLAAGALMLAGSLVGAAAWGARAARRMAPLAWVLAAVDALALVAIARITVSVDPSATLAWAFVLWVPFSIAARARASSALLGTAGVAALVLSAALVDVGALRALPHTWGAVGVPAALVLVAGAATTLVTLCQHMGRSEVRGQLIRERDQALRLREADSVKNTFLAAVSHELRTPLTSILGFSLTMLDRPELDAAQRERMLRTVVVEAEHLEDILANLLDLDRLTRGSVTLAATEVDPAAIVRAAVEHAQRRSTREVATDLAGGLRMRLDAPKFERIVENLVANALKYTPADAQVSVTLSAGARDGIVVRVDDTGPGIPREQRDAIFQPFQRGDTITGAAGTGIGLSLVEHFTRMHGGRVWVEERPGGGCRFQVELPGDVADAATGLEAGASGSSRSSSHAHAIAHR